MTDAASWPHLHQALGFVVYLSNSKGFVEVCMGSVKETGDIDIQDVPFHQFSGVWNPVTDDFVNACTNALWKVMVL